ncbi:hypothetical protein DFJ74DRAFT_771095 [Hyaloraphidium curvatum]|nr:hypothetical protein DFJ74DRAFT_771095 [Hyaloraphidium curvatum]
MLRASPHATDLDDRAYADDLRVLLRFLEIVGKTLRPRRTADNFRRTLVAAGIPTVVSLQPLAQLEEAEEPSVELATSGTFRPAADPRSAGRTYAEMMTEADRSNDNGG